MAKMAQRISETAETGNVLEDLGFPDAKELDLKVRFAVAINKMLATRKLTQKAAAKLLGVNQPKISALQNYKLDGLSVARLMTFATALGYDIFITLKPRSIEKTAARVKSAKAA